MRITRTVAAVGAAGALAVAAALPAIAQVDEDTTVGELQERHRTAHEQRRAAFAEALAERLDVPVEDVEAALEDIRAEREAAREAARDARLDALVEDGTITPEQADALRELSDAAPFGRRGFGPHGRGGHHGWFGVPGGADGDMPGESGVERETETESRNDGGVTGSAFDASDADGSA